MKKAAQVEADSIQLKFMSGYAQTLIYEVDEHTIKTSERIKANAAK